MRPRHRRCGALHRGSVGVLDCLGFGLIASIYMQPLNLIEYCNAQADFRHNLGLGRWHSPDSFAVVTAHPQRQNLLLGADAKFGAAVRVICCVRHECEDVRNWASQEVFTSGVISWMMVLVSLYFRGERFVPKREYVILIIF